MVIGVSKKPQGHGYTILRDSNPILKPARSFTGMNLPFFVQTMKGGGIMYLSLKYKN
jgi:hypothetical protein